MRTSKGEMKSSLKKGAWSAEEDRKLIAYINRYGIWNWSHMPKFAGLLRSGKSCRLRWMNYLKPDLKKGSFSEEEERSILHFHSILGNRWSAIARKLPGRSDNEIKNYWHTNLKKRAVANKQLTIKNSKQKSEINTPPCNFQSSDHNLQKITDQEDDLNHVTDITNFLFSWTPEDDITSITSINTSSGHEVDRFTGDHIGSPGTVEDLQCFWRDLYPLDQDLELGNIDHNQEMSFLDDVLLDSYNDPIVPWGFYNNEYEIMSTSVV